MDFLGRHIALGQQKHALVRRVFSYVDDNNSVAIAATCGALDKYVTVPYIALIVDLDHLSQDGGTVGQTEHLCQIGFEGRVAAAGSRPFLPHFWGGL